MFCVLIVKAGMICCKLTGHFHLFHGFLKTTGFGLGTLYCGNEDCKAGFDSFSNVDHVLNCTIKETQAI